MFKEEFKDIEYYEGLYQVSNIGRVKSLKRKAKNHPKNYTVKEKILKPEFVGPGKKKYLAVTLCKNGKHKLYKIHRLVMNTFKPNPNPEIYTEIDHIRNGNTLYNSVDDLEWVTSSENKIRAYQRGERKPPMSGITSMRIILQIDKNTGRILNEFESIHEVVRQTKINQGNICSCCKGKRKSAGGFIWEYKKNERINL